MPCGSAGSCTATAEAFPQSGEGGCERSEQTDEGAGKQQLMVITPHPALRATFPPRGEGF